MFVLSDPVRVRAIVNMLRRTLGRVKNDETIVNPDGMDPTAIRDVPVPKGPPPGDAFKMVTRSL